MRTMCCCVKFICPYYGKRAMVGNFSLSDAISNGNGDKFCILFLFAITDGDPTTRSVRQFHVYPRRLCFSALPPQFYFIS